MLRNLCCLLGILLAFSAFAAAKPLQTFTVKEYLRHQWTDELVHFPLSFHSRILPRALVLTDENGQPMPCQVSGLTKKNGVVSGTVWTVVTLPPKGTVTFNLQAGKPLATPLRLQAQGSDYLLGNEHLTLRLPKFAGTLKQPVDLATLPAPLLAVSDKDGKNWYGQGTWVNGDQPLQVKTATTSVIEEGPVRVTVRYRLVFTDDRYYQADIILGARQDAALFTDDTNIEAPKAAFRFSFQQGLGADRMYWRSNWFADRGGSLTPGPVDFSKEQVICNMRAWSYWWAKDLTTSAGFFKNGADPFVGVIAVRPSRWTPYGWDGFDRTQLPITARPGGQLDLTLALLAWTMQHTDETKLSPLDAVAFDYSQEKLARQNGTDSALKVMPQHRELAFTVGSATENVVNDFSKAKLRRQLTKYSEFPLDEVKDYAFDYQPAHPERQHPFLLFTQDDIDRARRQAKTVPAAQVEFARVNTQVGGALGDSFVTKIQKGPDGWLKFYQENFVGNGYGNGTSQQAYMTSDEKKFGIMLAAGVKGMARTNVEQVLENPWRPCIGGFAHVYPGSWTNLLFAYDAIAGTDYLTPEEKQEINADIVFGAHVVAHPDYWNTGRGLCSANPNMTALVKLPRGLLALFLDGHPEADAWLKVADDEIQREMKAWISPGGAWIECPGYQGASLDPMFPFMQAMKNVKGKDYFADPNFKATMGYYGFLLTPLDKRFPPNNTKNLPAPMALPSIGDMPSGSISVYPGWMAQGTAKSDPAFSAHQEYAWKAMLSPYGTMYAQGYTVALTDPELPASPPDELSKAFPGFGSILRTSWTDPNASYVAHRTGPNLHHYHDDYNEIVYYAKGSPLVQDFGNQYEPLQRGESWYHSRVGFNAKETILGPYDESVGELEDTRLLPHMVDYSRGKSVGRKQQQDTRHLVMVKSDDPLGANYLVLRDTTVNGIAENEFYWNLWCLANEPQITGSVVHFPGQLGVDLDVHLLSPVNPQISSDTWGWKHWIGNWALFSEEQYGIHVHKSGSTEDFFAVLYPRAPGQAPAQVTALANGAAVRVAHMEGADVLLLSPGKATTATDGDVSLTGEIALARRYTNGTLRLATMKGNCVARLGDWALASDGACSLEVNGKAVTGESSGVAHTAQITVPAAFGAAAVSLDGKAFAVAREGNRLTMNLPAGAHTITITAK